MKTLFSRLSRPLGYGLVAFGLLAGAASPLQAGPMPQPNLTAPASVAVTPVRDGWSGAPAEWRWRNRGGRDHAWRGDRGWRRDHGWRNAHRHWRGDWDGPRWRHGWRRHHGGAYFGWGLGLGMGLIPSYNYYYVEPRRHYRGLSRAHVEWCYARYRTYRAWDNTYVPRRGIRAQCRSPFG